MKREREESEIDVGTLVMVEGRARRGWRKERGLYNKERKTKGLLLISKARRKDEKGRKLKSRFQISYSAIFIKSESVWEKDF